MQAWEGRTKFAKGVVKFTEIVYNEHVNHEVVYHKKIKKASAFWGKGG